MTRSEEHAPLVWIDLEMSGLDPTTHHILEIASMVTDANLEIIAEGPDLVIHHPESVIRGMNAWCVEHHTKSGLTDAVRASTISLEEAEQQTIEFLRQHTQEGASPACGNSVWKDRLFLSRHMPTLDAFLHYRIVDVTSIKELVRRWYPQIPPPTKEDSHRALQDIRESINELRLYRTHVFRGSDDPSRSKT
jgi:oligoribonuclease